MRIDPANVEAVMTFIRGYVTEHHTGPLIIEIADACGLSKGTARNCVRTLKTMRRVRSTYRRRSIVPADVPDSDLQIKTFRQKEKARRLKRALEAR